jgi:hypothetical protein
MIRATAGAHFDHLSQIGIMDKLVQFVLIAVLLVLARRE